MTLNYHGYLDLIEIKSVKSFNFLQIAGHSFQGKTNLFSDALYPLIIMVCL